MPPLKGDIKGAIAADSALIQLQDDPVIFGVISAVAVAAPPRKGRPPISRAIYPDARLMADLYG